MRIEMTEAWQAECLPHNDFLRWSRHFCLLTLVFFLLLPFGTGFGAEEKLIGGNGTLYVGGRPGHIAVIDEATEKVIGQIQMKTGTPSEIELSQDKKRFYCQDMSFENIEIVDIASRQSIDNFKLSEGNKKARIFGYEADPLNRFMILMVKTATKLPDRWKSALLFCSSTI